MLFSFLSSLLFIFILPKKALSNIYDDFCIEGPPNDGPCITCQDGYYVNPEGWCNSCSNPNTCKRCKEYGIGLCTECVNGYYLQGGSCYECGIDLCIHCSNENSQIKCTECPPGYFVLNGACSKCHETCIKCKGPESNQCTQCIDGYYSTSTSVEHSCTKCATNCKECHGPNIEDCDVCSDGWYKSGDRCIGCDAECKTCEEVRNQCTSCKDGFILDGHLCLPCTSNCKECKGTGEYDCKECFDEYYPQNGRCVSCLNVGCSKCKKNANGVSCTECPEGYATNIYDYDGDDETVSCDVCHVPGCSSCKPGNTYYGCDDCKSGYIMLNPNECTSCDSNCASCTESTTKCLSCYDRFYLDKVTNTCQNCSEHCLHCNSATDCYSCEFEYYPLNGKCEQCHESCHQCHDGSELCDECKIGYYTNSNHTCTKCDDNCLDCNSTYCFTCASDFYYDVHTKSCARCHDICSQCHGPTIDDCDAGCDPGYYYLHSNNVCVKCDDPCETCSRGGDTGCIDCAKGYFMNRDSGIRRCQKCEYNCINCSDLYHCHQCEDGYRLYHREEDPNEDDLDCQPCKNQGCKKCDSARDQCTECKNGYYESAKDGSNFVTCSLCPPNCPKCKLNQGKLECSECADGYYANNGNCIRCTPPCGTCTSASTCLSCANGYLFDGISSCKSTCSPNCLSCESTPETCTSCNSGFTLSGSKCISCEEGCKLCSLGGNCVTCQDGYFSFSDQSTNWVTKCRKCNSECATCHSSDVLGCTSCATGYYFIETSLNPGTQFAGKCVPCNGTGHEHCQRCLSNCNDDSTDCVELPICTRCDEGYYIDGNDECQQCHSTCATCSGPSEEECITCKDDYFFFGNKCTKCSDTCLTCDKDPSNCTSCVSGKFVNNGVCESCEGDCEECQNNANYCTKCKDRKWLYEGKCYKSCYDVNKSVGANVTTRECYDCPLLDNCISYDDACQCETCKEGFYLATDPITRHEFCQPCQLQNCKACNGAGKNDCTECISGYYLYTYTNTGAKECRACKSPCTVCTSETLCSDCIKGYFANSESHCEQCKEPCTECSGVEGKTCTGCIDGYYHTDKDECANCHEFCAKCTGPTSSNCSACSPGYFFDGVNTCSKCTPPCADCTAQSPEECTSCIDNYFLSGKECLKCEAPCLNCKGSKTTCTSCQDGYSLDGSTCKACPTGCKTCTGSPATCQTCIDGYYHATDKCTKCDEGCATCEGSGSNCQTCTGGYYHEGTGCHKCAWPCLNCTGPTNNTCQSCITGFVFNETTSSCDVSPNACPSGQHCDFTNNEGESKNFTTDLPKYEGIDNPTGNGGALKLVNYGFVGIDSEFTNCNAPSGGGGAIFIFNSIQKSEGKEITQTILLQGLKFTSCKAKYGAAVYIYSESENSPVQILSCQFKSNQVISSGSGALKGGSALYLTVKEGKVNNCIFSENKGEGGAVKVSDDFAQKPEMLSNFSQGLIEFSGCTFNIEKNSDCSLFYVNNKRSTKVQINNCEFTGQLAKGAHFIDGQSIQKEMPNLFINSCKFATDENGALNSKFIKVDLGNQVLSQKGLSKKQFTPKMLATLSMIAAAALIIIVSTVIIIKRNGNDGASSREISQESIEA